LNGRFRGFEITEKIFNDCVIDNLLYSSYRVFRRSGYHLKKGCNHLDKRLSPYKIQFIVL